LIPPNNPEALAAAISEVLGDPSLSDRFRREARRRAEQKFAIHDAAQNLWSYWQG
jgi:glycosyltransferase involved in cell wall biosynthesis